MPTWFRLTSEMRIIYRETLLAKIYINYKMHTFPNTGKHSKEARVNKEWKWDKGSKAEGLFITGELGYHQKPEMIKALLRLQLGVWNNIKSQVWRMDMDTSSGEAPKHPENARLGWARTTVMKPEPCSLCKKRTLYTLAQMLFAIVWWTRW